MIGRRTAGVLLHYVAYDNDRGGVALLLDSVKNNGNASI